MDTKHSHIPIEETLNEYVEEFGGTLVEKIISNPAFSNADYLFKDYKIVAELKTLKKDFLADIKYKEKVNYLYTKWVDEGLVRRRWGRTEIQTRNLPVKCQKEFTEIFKRPVERVISKANKQIKQTKEYFGLNDYKGVLILVNDGNYSLESSGVSYFVDRIVNTQCTSIDSTIYFTVNMVADMPNIDKDLLVWVDQPRRNTKGVSRNFIQNFSSGWFEFIERKLGEELPIISMDEHEKLEEIKFIKNKKE